MWAWIRFRSFGLEVSFLIHVIIRGISRGGLFGLIFILLWIRIRWPIFDVF